MTITELLPKLRRMIAEPTDANYSDEELELLLESQAIRDIQGNDKESPEWIETYDINRLASDIWGDKASLAADEFDFNADGADYKRSQKYQNAIKQSAYYRSRSFARSLAMKQYPVNNIGSLGYQDLPYKDNYEDEDV